MAGATGISNAGSPAPVATAGSAAPPTTGPDTAPGLGVPCEVAKAVSNHCTLCHATKLQGGAPMPLMTLKDFQAQSKSNPAMTVAQLVPLRVNATEQAKLMPPINSTKPLMAADKMMLSDWASAGAKGVSTNACAITEPTGMMMDPTMVPGGKGGMGGASLEPIEYDDPEMKCYKFLTHAQGDKDAPYMHGPGEEYVNFSFKAPWTGTVYTRAHKLAVGDAPILHHWLLYVDQRPGVDGGISGNSTGIHPSSNLLHAWAPGANPLYFDPDVGMKLDDTRSPLQQLHRSHRHGPQRCRDLRDAEGAGAHRRHDVDGQREHRGHERAGHVHAAQSDADSHHRGAAPHAQKGHSHEGRRQPRERDERDHPRRRLQLRQSALLQDGHNPHAG
jgi:hypothetical protein